MQGRFPGVTSNSCFDFFLSSMLLSVVLTTRYFLCRPNCTFWYLKFNAFWIDKLILNLPLTNRQIQTEMLLPKHFTVGLSLLLCVESTVTKDLLACYHPPMDRMNH